MSQLDGTTRDIIRAHCTMAAFLWRRYPRYARRLVEQAAIIVREGLFDDEVWQEAPSAPEELGALRGG